MGQSWGVRTLAKGLNSAAARADVLEIARHWRVLAAQVEREDSSPASMTACRSFMARRSRGDAAGAQGHLEPCPSERMTLWRLTGRVGNVRNDSSDLFEPLRDTV